MAKEINCNNFCCDIVGGSFEVGEKIQINYANILNGSTLLLGSFIFLSYTHRNYKKMSGRRSSLVLPTYYYFSILACLLFTLQVAALFLPFSLATNIVQFFFYHTDMFLQNALIFYLFFKLWDSKRTILLSILSSLLVCSLEFTVVLVVKKILKKFPLKIRYPKKKLAKVLEDRSDVWTCQGCAWFFPTKIIAFVHLFFLLVYLVLFILNSRGVARKTLRLLLVYNMIFEAFFAAFGFLVFFKLNAGFCGLSFTYLFYSISFFVIISIVFYRDTIELVSLGSYAINSSGIKIPKKRSSKFQIFNEILCTKKREVWSTEPIYETDICGNAKSGTT